MTADSTPPQVDDAAVNTEVVALHDFFTAWFRGEHPDTDEAFAPLPRALAEGFVLISPGGTLMARPAILGALRGAHTSWAENDTIEIRNTQVRQRTGDTIVATYEEWQRKGGVETGRVSTVVFTTQLRWLHVHETWLPESATP